MTTITKKQDQNVFLFDQDDEQEQDIGEFQSQNLHHQDQIEQISQVYQSSQNNNSAFQTFSPLNNSSQFDKKADYKKRKLENSQHDEIQLKYEHPNDIIIFDQDDESQLPQQENESFYHNGQFQRKAVDQKQKQIILDTQDLKRRILFSDKTHNYTNSIPSVLRQSLRTKGQNKTKYNKSQNQQTKNEKKIQGKNSFNNQNKSLKIQKRQQKWEQKFSQFQQSKVQIKESMIGSSDINSCQKMIGANIKNKQFKQLQYVQQKKSLKVNNMKQFLFTQISPQFKINAIIKKVNSGFIYGTKYAVFIQENNKFLFSVLKDGLNKFIFSFSKQNISEKNKNYLGKLVSNFSGSQFVMFDDGFDPSQTKSLEFCHRQIAHIKYDDYTGPRKFQTVISTNNNKGFHVIQNQQNLIKQKWQGKQRKNLCKFYSKKPTYDPIDGNYKLDFKGMLGQPSIKNFILQNDQYKESLIFGRRNKEDFAVQIRSPFSLIQAVAICISSIHYKVFL